jgi:hypothetical protein
MNTSPTRSASVMKPARATLPAATAGTPHGLRALCAGRTLRQTHAADDATAGRTVSFDEYLAACV